VEFTSDTASQVRRIAASAEEQSAAHHQVNAAVSEVNEIAQETSHGMVHTAEAVTYLAAQAGELKELIDSMVSGGGESSDPAVCIPGPLALETRPVPRASGPRALEARQGMFSDRGAMLGLPVM